MTPFTRRVSVSVSVSGTRRLACSPSANFDDRSDYTTLAVRKARHGPATARMAKAHRLGNEGLGPFTRRVSVSGTRRLACSPSANFDDHRSDDTALAVRKARCGTAT